jgi:DNA-binding response OmpR family regulator
MEKILIIEDDKDVAELTENFLKLCGFYVETETNGADAVKVLLDNKSDFDAALLDIMLPEKDGFEVLRSVRQEFLKPVIVVSARSDEADKIRAFSLGADDYIVKPASLPELVARLRAHMERYRVLTTRQDIRSKGSVTSEKTDRRDAETMLYPEIRSRGLCIDIMKRSVTLNGADVALSRQEFDLLLYMALNPGRIFTKEELYKALWNESAVGYENTVYQHIKTLRDKLKNPQTEFIKTVWGRGYMFI